MYTSLELAVRLPVVSETLSLWEAAPKPQIRRSPSLVLMACLIADFHTYNLVKVGSSDNNKEQCQNV
ncbi:hypothetical protein [Anabaena subtropica]|uniref:Uncharacterized protein n=1 Tax=Anabaena subtropica FACHB-260 TaxID=2692884 RepID=A0ABR8CJG7_9NOST|nr:hypothetical protein [Anabaena subtropica]MBD2342994.1 hypothetical protein [Anabaena subtropica FACHB-260]